MITYDDFAQLHIALGKILSVDVVEGADKLLNLSVDVGEDTPRQIVSGIRQYFPDPTALVGQTFPFLINLEYRMIRGVESQGMILAAGTMEGEFAMLSPDPVLLPGTKIR